MAGAEYLQSIFGTEKDKVNCPFYFKIGACRHGDKCERRHNKPTLSQTLLIMNMFQNPVLRYPHLKEQKAQEIFDDFYEDVYEELVKFGEIEELNVCDNICDHMCGNVYVKYYAEDSAERALKALTGRFYGGKPIVAEFSPVTDFREASCRQYEMHECTRGGHCNFMHLKQISKELHQLLFGKRTSRRKRSRSPGGYKRKRSRSRERERDRRSRSRSPRRHRSRDRDRDRERERERRGDRERSGDRERERVRERERSEYSRGENSGEGTHPKEEAPHPKEEASHPKEETSNSKEEAPISKEESPISKEEAPNPKEEPSNEEQPPRDQTV